MPSVATTTRVEHFAIGRHHEHKSLTRRFERASPQASRYERHQLEEEESEQVYESYYERRPASSGPAKSNQRRTSQPTAAAAAAAVTSNGKRGTSNSSSSGNYQMNGSNLNHGSPQRVRLVETNGAHFGSEGQRASRSSLAGSHANVTRVGRFVNYYPASRQPSPSGRRQPNPYAFHVPSSQTLPPPPSSSLANQRDLYHYSSQYELIGAPQQRQQQQHQFESQPAMRQSSYGFVAPIDRVEGLMRPKQFNKSLRSRTISHLPSMVQVSIQEGNDDDDEDDNDDDKHSESQLEHCGNDLLKAHVVVWRSDAQLEQDNPFKPGTELSWEAELMVRLIQRGYPMDQLPSLVEAAKVEAARRRSGPRPKPIPNSRSMSQLTQPAAATLKYKQQIDPKAIWANSLKRTKSMPRFDGSKRDGDSIDRLITSIELEVQQQQQRDQEMGQQVAEGCRVDEKESTQSEKINKGALIGKIQSPLGSSPSRTKPTKTKSSPIREPNLQQQQSRAPSQTRGQQVGGGQLAASSELKRQTGTKTQTAVVKQKKRRCCTIH